MVVFVAATQAGVLPLAYSASWPYAAPLAWDGITQYASLPHSSVIASTPLVRTAHWAPEPVLYAATPAITRIIPGEAKYTAVNRGAIHEAPLPGHALSQTSLNVAPAPGTW